MLNIIVLAVTENYNIKIMDKESEEQQNEIHPNPINYDILPHRR